MKVNRLVIKSLLVLLVPPNHIFVSVRQVLFQVQMHYGSGVVPQRTPMKQMKQVSPLSVQSLQPLPLLRHSIMQRMHLHRRYQMVFILTALMNPYSPLLMPKVPLPQAQKNNSATLLPKLLSTTL